jgi:hypothetical protein
MLTIKQIKRNEAGFTFIELLMATAMSLIILGLLAHVFRSQEKEFSQQTGLNTMQANGRAATEFVARSVQNAGYNVNRGTRFLAASDHYLTAVYDANKDDVIQNDEVITYTLANTWSGSATDTFSFTAHYDVDGNGTITSSEDPDIDIEMTATAPPFHLYKVVPNQAGNDIERSMVARNIDNMVIKYYDRNGKLLPIMNDTDDDGVGDTVLDADDDGIPDNGNWTYQFPLAELNDIRKVEIDILARSRKPDPREVTHSGSYPSGSFAAVKTGGTSYSDKYNREDFTAQMAPRNLVMAPWGSVEMIASPVSVDCPNTSTVTATLLDANGDPISGSTINFAATGGTTTTIGSPTQTSDSSGEGSTLLTYDFSSPYFTSTISGSALVDDGSGGMKPIYSATPVSFAFSSQGGFVEPFDGSQPLAWTDVPTTAGFQTIGEEYLSNAASGVRTGSLNGCAPWEDYSVQTNVRLNGATFVPLSYYGVILRYQDANNYYYAKVIYDTSPARYKLRVGRRIAGTDTMLSEIDLNDAAPSSTAITGGPIAYDMNTPYTLKAQISGNEVRARFWEPADPADPAADEPPGWLTGTGSGFLSGLFGVFADDNTFLMDDVILGNAAPTS